MAFIDEFTTRLFPDAKREANGEYTARCPLSGHNNGDKHPSLRIFTALSGHVCMQCRSAHRGMDTKALCEAMGIDLRETYPQELRYSVSSEVRTRPNPPRTSTSTTAMAVSEDPPQDNLKHDPKKFRAGGTREFPPIRYPAERIEARYLYVGTPTDPIMVKFRISDPSKDNPDADKPGKTFDYWHWVDEPGSECGWYNERGSFPRMFYRHEWLDAVKGKAVFLVEGEKSNDILSGPLGQLSFCGDDGSHWHPEYTIALVAANPKEVVILPDNDIPGEKYAHDAAKSLTLAGIPVRLLHLKDEWLGLKATGDIADIARDAGVLEDDQNGECRKTVLARLSKLYERGEVWTLPPEEEAATFEPFDAKSMADPPEFPLDALPIPLRNMALETARSFQVNAAMTAPVILGIVSTCLLKKFIVTPRPDWWEQMGVYQGIVARPSERKSPVLRRLLRPVEDFVYTENCRLQPEMNKQILSLEFLGEQINEAKKMAKGGEDAAATDNVLILMDELDAAKRKMLRPLELLADDFTTEALVGLMESNNGRISVVTAEAGIFGTLTGRYNKRPNLDPILKAYDGDPIKVTRIGRPNQEVRNPSASITLMMQPVILETIMRDPDLTGRGVLARFCFIRPKSHIGSFDPYAEPISEETSTAYERVIYALLSISEPNPEQNEQPRAISFGSEARELFAKLCVDNDRARAELNEDDAGLEGFLGKHCGRIARMAALIHAVNHPGEDGEEAVRIPVDETELKAAMALGDFYETHARTIYAEYASDTEAETDAKYILSKLSNIEDSVVTTRQLIRIYCRKRKFKKVADLEPGLQELEQRGYIRRDGSQITILHKE